MVFGRLGGTKRRNLQLWDERAQAITHQDEEALSSHRACAVLGGAHQAGMAAADRAAGQPDPAEQLA